MSASGTPPRPPTQLVPSSREPERPLARRDREVGLTMVYSPLEAKKRLEELRAFVKSVMVPGVDFMVIPGTRDKVPTLLQPGAQKLAEIYGFAHRYIELKAIEDFERDFFYVQMRCILSMRRTGDFVGEGIGSANSKENQNERAGRWVQGKDLPEGISHEGLRAKEMPSRYPNGKPYTVYLVEVPQSAANLLNSIQKKAAKRAYVHAVLSVTRSSDLFTQDLEVSAEAYGVVDEERSWERAAPEPIIHRDVKPDNNVSGAELRAMRELGPAAAQASSLEEVEVLRKEAVLAAPDGNPSPDYLAWYERTFGEAQARLGGGR